MTVDFNGKQSGPRADDATAAEIQAEGLPVQRAHPESMGALERRSEKLGKPVREIQIEEDQALALCEYPGTACILPGESGYWKSPDNPPNIVVQHTRTCVDCQLVLSALRNSRRTAQER